MGREYKRFMSSSGDSFMIILNQKFAMQIVLQKRRQQRGKAEQREVYNFWNFETVYFYGFPKLQITRENRTVEDCAFVNTAISNFAVLEVWEVAEVRAPRERQRPVMGLGRKSAFLCLTEKKWKFFCHTES